MAITASHESSSRSSSSGDAFPLLFVLGLNFTHAGHSSLMLGLTPVFVALIALALRIERASRRVWASIWLSFIGVVMITSGSDPSTSSGGASGQVLGGAANGPTLLGDLLSLAATFCWSCYTVLAKPLLGRYSPLKRCPCWPSQRRRGSPRTGAR